MKVDNDGYVSRPELCVQGDLHFPSSLWQNAMNERTKATSQDGRWPKGITGNSFGRPRGSRNKATLALESLLESGAEKLVTKAIEMALAGDTAAMGLCLECILPLRKEREIYFDRPTGSGLAQVQSAIYILDWKAEMAVPSASVNVLNASAVQVSVTMHGPADPRTYYNSLLTLEAVSGQRIVSPPIQVN